MTPRAARSTQFFPEDDVAAELWLRQLCDGDLDALRTIYDRYCRLVYGIAYRVLKNPDEAEEMVQEVFFAIYRNANSKAQGKGTVRSWIIGITYKCSVTRWRHLAVRRYYDTETVDCDHTEDRTVALYDDILAVQQLLSPAMGLLSPRQRTTLRMYFWEGCELHEIADRLQESFPNTRNHFYRGIAILRKAITGERNAQATHDWL